MRRLPLLLLFSFYLQAQTAATPIVINHFFNHGGWGLDQAIGSDEGDRINLGIFCDHPVNGQCFAVTPWIVGEDGTQIQFTKEKDRTSLGTKTQWGIWTGHQVWTAIVPKTGLWHVRAEYYWVGTDIHYWGPLVVWEHVKL